MNHDDLEARMREAIPSGSLKPSAELWQRIARHGQPAPRSASRRRAMLASAFIGIAALLLFLLRVPGDTEKPPRRSVETADGTQPTFWAPSVLMAQSPTFPMVKGAGPRGLRLRAGRWTYLTVRADADTQPDRYSYSIIRGSINGDMAWILANETTHPNAWRPIDSLWVSADSLRPLFRVTNPGSTRLEQTFRHDDVLSGYFSASGYVNWKTTPLSDTTRFNEASIIRWQDLATIFMTIPLTREWNGSIPLSAAPEYGSIRPTWLNLSVDGEERVTTPAGTFDCWRLRMGMRAEPPAGTLLGRQVIEEPDVGIHFYVSKDKGWLIRQSYRGGEREPTSELVLAEAAVN